MPWSYFSGTHKNCWATPAFTDPGTLKYAADFWAGILKAIWLKEWKELPRHCSARDELAEGKVATGKKEAGFCKRKLDGVECLWQAF